LSSFDEIYEANYKAINRVARKMMGNYDGIADIVQDVFIDLYDRLRNGYEIHHTESWLYRITYNKCIDNIRRQKKFKQVDLIHISATNDSEINRADLKNAMDHALEKLRPKEKILAVLYSEGLSYKEIAEATGIRMSSIGTLLSRTLLKIEKELKDKRYELY